MNKIFSLGLFLVSAVAIGAGDWPQWRGPARDGSVHGKPWPSSIDETVLRPLWRVELGSSYSGPIVSGDLVVTTETVGKKSESVRAYDRVTGKQIWHSEWKGAMSVPFFAKANGSWIRSTPATDGERLYVAGMRDVLVCLDLASGKELWRVDFVAELNTPLPEFGFVCSPLLDGDHVYVQAGAGFVKLDKKTGNIVWKSLRDDGGMMGSAFSSPVIGEIGGRRQLVVQTREKLAGVDLLDGKVLWEQEVPAFRGMNILTPVIHGDSVFTSTYGGKTVLFDITLEGGIFKVSNRWAYKGQGYMSTPVVVQGVAYHHLKSQRLLAIDLKDGKELWTTSKGFGKYWSLVTQGHRILALDQRGILFLFEANTKGFELTGERKVSETDTWAHLAVSGDQLFIRELNALAAWGWSE